MRFEKVSFEQFEYDMRNKFILKTPDLIGCDMNYTTPYEDMDSDRIREIYDAIELPTRSTIGSAGYDFSFPVKLTLKKGSVLQLPTGIKWDSGDLKDRRYLSIYPRSSLGSKYFLREPNLVSIIDSDYYNCEKNEGHIFVNLGIEGTYKELEIQAGQGYAQGIISRYEVTDDDAVSTIRKGGFGSTNR